MLETPYELKRRLNGTPWNPELIARLNACQIEMDKHSYKFMVEVAQPDHYQRGAPLFPSEYVFQAAAKAVTANSNYLTKRSKIMIEDLKEAQKITDEATARFAESLTKLMGKEREFAEASKRASGNVRDSANKLAQGLAQLEKTANFDRLEKLCALLERASSALTILSDLDKSGKLERIAKSLS